MNPVRSLSPVRNLQGISLVKKEQQVFFDGYLTGLKQTLILNKFNDCRFHGVAINGAV